MNGDAEAVRRRSTREVGVAAYLACVKAGDEEGAARIAGEMHALGLGAPDARPCEDAAGALEALRFDWGGFYMIGADEVRGWWAARHGRIGTLITADGPGELRAAMAEDFGPVKA